MKKTAYSIISLVLIGVGVATAIYPFIPVEAQEYLLQIFPEFNQITAMAVGGSGGVLGGSMFVAREIANKTKSDTLNIIQGLTDKYTKLEAKYQAVESFVKTNTEATDNVARLVTENTKEVRKHNKLIETDLLIKRENRFLSKQGKDLIDEIVGGHDEPKV